jgi:hypothetical protein
VKQLDKKKRWLAPFGCCLTGRQDAELCHLHEGEFTSHNQKVGDHLTLPMSRRIHEAQHKHQDEFWLKALPGGDPREWAVRLHDIWEARDLEAAEDFFFDMQHAASPEYLSRFLIEPARLVVESGDIYELALRAGEGRRRWLDATMEDMARRKADPTYGD